ncbi:MAG: acylphosphatase [Arcobacter sp.]|nr:acylphosphatase [Arcobacter sp.]
MKSYKFIVSGTVQGVYYRKTIKENASKYKFNGYVKNLTNGKVEAVVTCEDRKVKEFISILKKGSIYSKVTNIVESTINEIYTKGFSVKY